MQISILTDIFKFFYKTYEDVDTKRSSAENMTDLLQYECCAVNCGKVNCYQRESEKCYVTNSNVGLRVSIAGLSSCSDIGNPYRNGPVGISVVGNNASPAVVLNYARAS